MKAEMLQSNGEMIMVDMKEVNEEIRRLEEYDLTYKIAEKLAVLYAIRNENGTEPMELTHEVNDVSEFSETCKDVPNDCLMKIMDEHFMAVKTIFPKEYELVMKKIYQAKRG